VSLQSETVSDPLDISRVFRDEWSRIVAALARSFGDLQLAEDAAQEAFTEASATWAVSGVPRNPGGWIHTVARRRAIDRVRRESVRAIKHRQAMTTERAAVTATVGGAVAGPIDDDVLRLIFTCCHPALEPTSRVALTLRLVSGIDTAAIARAFLVKPDAMSQRLTRAKRKVRSSNIPLRMPEDAELPERLAPVLAVINLVFNEGYVATTGDQLDRPDLCDEAIHLGRLLTRLMPAEPEVRGVLALMLLIAARRPARVGSDGSLVPLPEQDRSRWDRELVAEGHELVRSCLRQGRPGQYQLHAAINAVHTDARAPEETEWCQILTLYDQLRTIAPTPVIELNRAVAVAEVHGPRTALAIVERLDLQTYQTWHATRADLLRRCGRIAESAAAYQHAARLTGNLAELGLIARRLEDLGTNVH
jgi:RNA polymerase sigma-70 factor, ECF subfamily